MREYTITAGREATSVQAESAVEAIAQAWATIPKGIQLGNGAGYRLRSVRLEWGGDHTTIGNKRFGRIVIEHGGMTLADGRTSPDNATATAYIFADDDGALRDECPAEVPITA